MDLSKVKHLPKVDHTPAHLDEISRLLLKGAEVIERDGWCQNEMVSLAGRVCLEGALLRASGVVVNHTIPAWRYADSALVYDALTRVMQRLGGIPAHRWNDASGRNQEEVVAKLRAVALGL